MKREKQQMLASSLKEWGVTQQDLSYDQAAFQLAQYLKIKKPDSAYRCQFGAFAICADSYEILTQQELDQVRRFLNNQYGPAGKITVWTRVQPETRLTGNTYVATLLPHQVLWEMTGVDLDVALNLCGKVRDLLCAPMKILKR